MTHWFEAWHGSKLPATEVSGLSTGGGSTNMSTGVTLALAGKAASTHPHGTTNITGLDGEIAAINSTLSGKSAVGHGHYKADVTDFAHTHGSTDVVGLDSTLAAISSTLAGKAASVHAHGTTNVTGLDGLISGLTAGVSSKADTVHTHASTYVIGLDSTLAAISSTLAGKAATVHTHGTTNITGLDGTLELKAASTHTHPPIAGGAIPSTWCSVSTHVLTGSTTMQPVTGLVFDVSSASLYRFEFVVGWQTISSATGIAFGVNGPASPLMMVYEVGVSTGLGGMVMKNNRAFGVQTIASLQIDSSGVNSYGYLGGLLRNGASTGKLQLQFASEVAGSTVSVRAGSLGFLFGPL